MARPFRFDFDKAIQSVGFLLRRETCRRMNYMRLLKILYLAEREILKESGKPLTGSRVVAMQRGPVLEDVYALVRSQHIDTPRWSKFFQKENFELVMVDDPGVGRLSRFVTDTLESVASLHQQDDEWAMVEFTHQLSEWKQNDPGQSSKEIPLEDILAAIGRSTDLERIVEGTSADEQTQAFFSNDLPLAR